MYIFYHVGCPCSFIHLFTHRWQHFSCSLILILKVYRHTELQTYIHRHTDTQTSRRQTIPNQLYKMKPIGITSANGYMWCTLLLLLRLLLFIAQFFSNPCQGAASFPANDWTGSLEFCGSYNGYENHNMFQYIPTSRPCFESYQNQVPRHHVSSSNTKTSV